MRRSTKAWLITALSMIIAGLIVFGGIMTMIKFDFTKLSTVKYETNLYEISEEFEGISVNTNTANVRFVMSEGSKCTVECYEQTKLKHSVSVKDGKLAIEVVDLRHWYDNISINFDNPQITVYLPKGEYSTLVVKSGTGSVDIAKDFSFESIDASAGTGNVTNHASASGDIKIKTSTGNISVGSATAASLSLSVSTGSVTVSDVTVTNEVYVKVSTGKTCMTSVSCKSLESSGNTGNVYLTNLVAAERIAIERTTGSVKFNGCDAGEIFVKTSTGSVTGSLLSGKNFDPETNTGDVEVPGNSTGGACEIITNTGDIKITVD